VRLDWVCSNIFCSFELTNVTVTVKKKVDLSCGGYRTSINYLVHVTARETFHSLYCDSLLKISLQTCEIVRHNVNAAKHKSDDMYLSTACRTRPFSGEQRQRMLYVRDCVHLCILRRCTNTWHVPLQLLPLMETNCQ
jgi:hypothetical protein